MKPENIDEQDDANDCPSIKVSFAVGRLWFPSAQRWFSKHNEAPTIRLYQRINSLSATSIRDVDEVAVLLFITAKRHGTVGRSGNGENEAIVNDVVCCTDWPLLAEGSGAANAKAAATTNNSSYGPDLILDLSLLGNLERIVDLDAEVSNGAFKFAMSKQKLHRS
ncbi:MULTISPECIES: hypothetical protein [unclassified Caballeronia]|uniref:hypothetical protein n=1 Tax=unclassified Caballeronia TaxID=2646786 RepID=UPI0020292E97|nr:MULTISPECIES: hypothetical protein [unclassified Caballeronia]